jgi:hypothetical protein
VRAINDSSELARKVKLRTSCVLLISNRGPARETKGRGEVEMTFNYRYSAFPKVRRLEKQDALGAAEWSITTGAFRGAWRLLPMPGKQVRGALVLPSPPAALRRIHVGPSIITAASKFSFTPRIHFHVRSYADHSAILGTDMRNADILSPQVR